MEHYFGQYGWPTKKILDFRWFKTTKVGNYKFLVKYFFQYFQIFSIFTYNEDLLMKSYLFIVIRLLLQRSHPHSWQPDSKKGNLRFPNPSSYAPFKMRSFYTCIGSCAVVRRMLKTRLTLGNISSVFLNLIKRLIFVTLREKCPNTEFFLSHIRTEYGEYGKIRTRKDSVFGHFSGSVILKDSSPPTVHAVNIHIFSLVHQLRLPLALFFVPLLYLFG